MLLDVVASLGSVLCFGCHHVPPGTILLGAVRSLCPLRWGVCLDASASILVWVLRACPQPQAYALSTSEANIGRLGEASKGSFRRGASLPLGLRHDRRVTDMTDPVEPASGWTTSWTNLSAWTAAVPAHLEHSKTEQRHLARVFCTSSHAIHAAGCTHGHRANAHGRSIKTMEVF